MLRLEAGQVLSLWDEVLPIGVRELPRDLAQIDALLADPGLLAPIAALWQAEAEVSGRSAAGHGRPTIAMAIYVRLMVVKQHSGWGYETLMREVSDSLHLRRFCLIAAQGGPGAAARKPSCARPRNSSSSPSAARRSPSRSVAAPAA